MQRADQRKATVAHRRTMPSTTLNRKYVQRPVQKKSSNATPIVRSNKITRFSYNEQNASTQPTRTVIKISGHEGEIRQGLAAKNAHSSRVQVQEKIQQPQLHPLQKIASDRMRERATFMSSTVGVSSSQKVSAKELKDRAIKKALESANKTTDTNSNLQSSFKGVKKQNKFSLPRILLAASCAAVAVFAIAYVVSLNIPDLSLRVAAVQTGIEASYPSYIPRDFSLRGVSSENGRIVLHFTSSSDGSKFDLVEENSSWDSSALLSNYVKNEFSEDYSTIREQGLTIYISGSNAAWVNGGVVYKISADNNTLTKKQISSIATSV